MTGRKCTATTTAGTPCRAWAVHGTSPPRCAPHGGGRARIGAPENNTNAVTHGVHAATAQPPTNLNTRIEDLDNRVQQLSEFIDNLDDKTALGDRLALLDMHGRLTSRLGRLMKDRASIAAPEASGMAAALREALSIASGLLGVDLLSKKSQSTFPI